MIGGSHLTSQIAVVLVVFDRHLRAALGVAMELLPGEGLYAVAMAMAIAFLRMLVRPQPQPQAAANVLLLFPAVRTWPWRIGFYTGIKFPLGNATRLQVLRIGGSGESSSFCFGRGTSSCR